MNSLAPIHPDAGVAARTRFFLATDLDGTFLGGRASAREALYNLVEDNRATIGLIFVTGRDPDFILDLCDTYGVPVPEYVVGDVGTTIARVIEDEIRPIPALEAEIAARWNDAGDRVRAALADAPGLTLQPTAFRYRVSYDLDPDAFDPGVLEVIEGMGLDVLMSDDSYLDVLPKGVSKGPSLRRLLGHLGVPEDRVLAAGDTLNDRSMLELSVPSVAVGRSEPALLEALQDVPRTHFAKASGAAGILEAIRAFDLHPVS
ncbi:HAD-IIB family hydrolase [Pseudaestuariivita atlantica]|uniref:Alpha,alpha-trehalose-phosphate synthase n=1 Tax=Pseudaestuariivita atlantica TaxID=1317121 RepID=A0A0L1JL65_9RHOB|nr:HAD-IIB family hydrolase [Pseudaestuariivita atlantica]KNG92168.1 alpha,alpha-trehalose-phosphate synthase [Pseudaestuariivita atlantica]